VLAKGDDQMVVDVKSLPNGVYFVQVRNGENTATRKLVVQQ
jgi:RNase adaptor protein for sRNA GlmZ degradation